MGKPYVRDGRYGIDYADHLGHRVRKVVASDKSVAQATLGQALNAVEQMRAGMVTADPRQVKKAISTHAEAYLGNFQRRGRDTMYI